MSYREIVVHLAVLLKENRSSTDALRAWMNDVGVSPDIAEQALREAIAIA
jgi:hypothetical protein